MFIVSENAVGMIRELTSMPGVPAGSGLRIATDPKEGSLQIALSAEPAPGDTVLQAGDDARIFVTEEAAEILDGQAVDASLDAVDGIQFLVGPTANSPDRPVGPGTA